MLYDSPEGSLLLFGLKADAVCWAIVEKVSIRALCAIEVASGKSGDKFPW